MMKPDLVSRLAALDTTIKTICSITGAPGLSLGVLQNGKIIHSAHYGYRDIEKKLAPDSNTIYGVASLSKAITASAVGILVDEGKLSWTTRIKSILEDLDSRDPLVTELLTITDLLVHNTGLAVSNNWWYGAEGDILLRKDQTVTSFNALAPKSKFRTQFDYSNWNYCMVGEVIEKLSGMSYGQFIQHRILDPLKLGNTSASHNNAAENLAKPYAVLEDGSPFLMPFPKVQDGTIMAPAQALRSTVNDMLTYASALLDAQEEELNLKPKGSANPLKYASKQLSGHISKGTSGLLEKSYGLGMNRFQLPQSLAGVGCNSMFVKCMPTITPGEQGGLLMIHTGSVVGYTSFLALLPEYDVALFVATNSIGLGDPAGWVTHLLLETIMDSPSPNDYVALAKEAATNHANREHENQRVLDLARLKGTQPKPVEAYLGNYVGLAGQFNLQIRLSSDGSTLQVAFQGLDSQVWDLKHYHHDTFTWLQPFDDQAKRGRFTFSGPDLFKLIFRSDNNGNIDRVFWAQEPGSSESKQCFTRVQQG